MRRIAIALLALGCSSTITPLGGSDASLATDSVVASTDVPRTTDGAVAQDIPARPDVPVISSDVLEPPTECALENDGRACASPGMGCAAAGGGCGVTSFQCECGANRRWACTVRTGPPCPDSGVITPSDGGTCSVVGVWSISFMGQVVYFSFELTTWRAAQTLDGLASPIARGSWVMRGDTVEIREDAGGMMTGCAPTDLGVYRPFFQSFCNTMRLELVSDQCSERGDGLSSWTFSRR